MMSEKAEGKLGGRFQGRHEQDWGWSGLEKQAMGRSPSSLQSYGLSSSSLQSSDMEEPPLAFRCISLKHSEPSFLDFITWH